MVRWLVQDEEIGIGEHQLRQGNPAPLPAAQALDLLEYIVLGEEEGGQYISHLGVVHVGIGILNFFK